MVRSSKADVLQDALALSTEDRADLARELIASLDAPGERDVEEAWAREVERRLREIDDGSAVLEDWSTVRARILTRLRAKSA